jgi:hypothetical protein
VAPLLAVVPDSEQVQHDKVGKRLPSGKHDGRGLPVGALEEDPLGARPDAWVVADEEVGLVHPSPPVAGAASIAPSGRQGDRPRWPF